VKRATFIVSVFSVIIMMASVSCAKVESSATNEAESLALDAWIFTHYGDTLPKIAHGIYVTEDHPGLGEMVDTNGETFLSINYYLRDLTTGAYAAYTEDQIAKQLHEYDSTNLYVPSYFYMKQQYVSQGIMDIIFGGKDAKTGKVFPPMRLGGKRYAIVPGWLSSTSQYYDTEEDYKANVTGTNYYYMIEVVDQTKDVIQRQINQIEYYMEEHRMEIWDTTLHSGRGFYYVRDTVREHKRGVEADMTTTFPSDTTIYINYVGRLLNGKVFDTNIADVAKIWGIYKSSGTYEPQAVTFSSDSTALTMNSSSVITGFSLSIWHMHPYESGTGLFTSDFGYKASGSNRKIPGYAPLIFEIDVVDEED